MWLTADEYRKLWAERAESIPVSRDASSPGEQNPQQNVPARTADDEPTHPAANP
jgi:hypothetical protein